MTQQIINIGSSPGAGNGDDLYTAFDKTNKNFSDIYGGNVLAANATVQSVAGRTGNVLLNWTDVSGVATQGDVTGLRNTISAANAAAQAYTDAAVSSLGTLTNINAVGGTLTDVQLDGHSWGNLANLSVTSGLSVAGELDVTGSIGTTGSMVVGGDITIAGSLRFADTSSMNTVFNPASLVANSSAQSQQINTINANVAAANLIISTLQANAVAQEAEISNSNLRVSAANASIALTNAGLTAANVKIATLFANAIVQQATLSVLTGNAAGQATQISLLNANLTSANLATDAIYSNVAALQSNAATQALQINLINANVAAANSAIAGFNNSGIATLNANVAAANVQIASLQQASILANNSIAGLTANTGQLAADIQVLFSNAYAQGSLINTLFANAASQQHNIQTINSNQAGLIANTTAANSAIAGVQANVTAANSAIAGVQANVTAANVAIVQTQGRVAAANAQIALRANITNPTFIGTVTTPTLVVSGTATLGTLSVTTFSASQITGQLMTNAQPNINSLGTLGNLVVSGNVNANWVIANNLRGTIITTAQPNITSLGTLGALAVAGTATVGNLIASSNITGTNATFTQLTSATANVVGLVNAGYLAVANTLTASAASIADSITVGNAVTAGNLIGTLLTANQKNITFVGNLTRANITGNLISGNITTGTIIAGNVYGTLTNPAQPRIQQVGTLAFLNVSGDAFIAGNIVSGGAGTNMSVQTLSATDIYGANIYASNKLTGTIATAAQPNITSVGALTALTVNATVYGVGFYTTGTTTTGSLIATGLQATSLTLSANATTGNISTGQLRTSGPTYGLDANYTGNVIAVGVVHGQTGDFSYINGLITAESAAQPHITSVGPLNGLQVSGDTNITGNLIVNSDFIVQGNLFVSGNTTTVNAIQITTQDHNLILADGSPNATSARGAGLLIGDSTGIYGNLTIRDGTWLSPNNFNIGGDIATLGNVSGTIATFTSLAGTLTTAAQPNITSVGTLGVLSVTGNIVAGNVTAGTIRATTAVQFSDGSIQTTAAPVALSTNLADINANITAANSAISGLSANITAANAAISSTNANVIAANSAISSTNANVIAANSAIGLLDANLGTATTNITTLFSNAGTQAASIDSTNANVTAANLAISDIQSNVTAANLAISSTNANVAAANLAIIGLATLASPSFTGTVIVDAITALGNVLASNITANNTLVASRIVGTLQSNDQPYITRLGDLIVANVTGNLSAGNVIATGNSYATNYTAIGNVTAQALAATYVYGTISTGSQPGITHVGTLDTLNVTGDISIRSVVSSGYVSSPLFLGQLGGGPQTGISQVGTLANLAVTDFVNVGNVIYLTPANGTITATLVKGTLATASQPNVTSVGTLTALTVDGNVLAGNLNANNTISAPSISGTIVTAVQTNITSIGTLSALAVAANIVTGNLTVNATSQLYNTIVSNAFAVIGTATLANASVGNINIANYGSITGSTANLTIANATITNAYIQSANIESQTDSTDSSSGALVVKGGVGILKSLNVNGLAAFASNVKMSANLSITPPGAGTTALSLGGSVYMFGASPGLLSNASAAQIFPSTVTTIEMGGEATQVNIGAISGIGNTTIRNSLYVAGNIFANIGNQSGNVTINSNLSVRNDVYAFSNIWGYGSTTLPNLSVTGFTSIGGNANVAGAVYVNSTYNGTNPYNAALQVRGGLGVVGNINSTGTTANIYSFTRTTGANTGALIVQGGAAIGGNLFIGGDATITGNVNFTAFLAASINATPIGNATPASGNFTTLGTTALRPQRRPTINVDFANQKRLDANKFTYSRTNQATYVDARGNLSVAANNVPRFTHDPLTLLPLGILLEESRQNLYVRTNEFANTTVWQVGAATVSTVASATTSPAGGYEAFKLTEDGTNSIHSIATYNATYLPTLTTTVTYTASVMAKAAGRNQISLVFFGEGSQPIFDLVLGTVTVEPAGTIGTIQTMGNGWYRCSTTITKTNNSSGIVSILLVNGTATTYTGDGTSGAYIFGAQLEQGTFATSYIPNTFAANTRGLDNLTFSSTQFAQNFDQQRGTVMVDAQLNYRPTTKLNQQQRSTLVSFNDGTASNRISIVTESLNSPVNRGANLVVYTSGVFQNNIIIATSNLTATGGSKIAAYYQNGLIQAALDGNTSVQSTSGNIPSNLNTMTVGSGPGTPALNGTIKKLQYYPEISTANEITYLTLQ